VVVTLGPPGGKLVSMMVVRKGAMQNVRLDGKAAGELDLQQATQDQAARIGQVLEVVGGVAVSIRRSAHVVAGKIRGETGPYDHAPIEPLPGSRGCKGHQQSYN